MGRMDERKEEKTDEREKELMKGKIERTNERKKERSNERKNRKKEGPSTLASAVELAASRPSQLDPRANSVMLGREKTWNSGL